MLQFPLLEEQAEDTTCVQVSRGRALPLARSCFLSEDVIQAKAAAVTLLLSLGGAQGRKVRMNVPHMSWGTGTQVCDLGLPEHPKVFPGGGDLSSPSALLGG